MDEMKKYLRRRLKTAADEMKRKLEAMAQERLDTLLARLPDGRSAAPGPPGCWRAGTSACGRWTSGPRPT